MKRMLEFNFDNNIYLISENNTILFEINPQTMKFDSKRFYEGIYKNQSSNIILSQNDDLDKKGKYIFNWVNNIITEISKKLGEVEDEREVDIEDMSGIKIIKLFDLPACAGNGNYIDDDSGVDYKTTNKSADYAVKISGESMEPTIRNGDIVLVKKHNGMCINDKIYIFTLEGEVMCKRFKKLKKGGNLVSDNTNSNYLKVKNSRISECNFLGEVIDVIHDLKED